MNRYAALVKEPNLILSLVTAGLALAVAFGWRPSDDQVAAILAFLAILLVVVRFLVTWRPDVAARIDSDGVLVAGPAATHTTGEPLPVEWSDDMAEAVVVVREPPGQHRRT